MLRGVNVGPHNRIKMEALRALHESLQFEQCCTYVQSGNVIFRAKETNPALLAKKIQIAFEKTFGFRSDVVLRTATEMRSAISASPFARRSDVEPGKLLITFLAAEPSSDKQAVLDTLMDYPEELHLKGRELYIYFPNGAGKSKLPWSNLGKLLGTPGTARNWNSVTRMLEMAEGLEKEK